MPRSWLKPTENLLVLFEELGGDPTRISLVRRSVSSVCADVGEIHPNIRNWEIESYGRTQELPKPKLHLHCGPGQSISSIKFASFGTPLGTCGSFQQGPCHASTSYSVLEKVTINSVTTTFMILITNQNTHCCISLIMIVVETLAEVYRPPKMLSSNIKY